MEENSPAPQQNKPGKLAFLEVGLFEIFFVAVVLLLLFGALNYFNILSVSDAFPRQLGWLPRQAVAQKKLLYTPAKPTLAPTPAVFNYNAEKAKTLLTQYIKDTIKAEFLPEKIEIKQGLSLDGTNNGSQRNFGVVFTSGSSSISANFGYKESTNIPNSYAVFVQLQNAVKATATASLTNSLLTSYFKNSYSASDCQIVEIGSYCENFQASAEVKKGYGMFIVPATETETVFTCLIPKESSGFNNLTSCLFK